MKRAELLRLDPIPPEKDEGYYASSMLHDMSGRLILEIDYHHGRELLFRYFADAEKEERATWYAEDGKWRGTKLENAVADVRRRCRLSYWNYTVNYDWIDDRDKIRALDYLGDYSIDSWEGQCDRDKRYTAAKRKEIRIQKEVDSFPMIPEAVEDWVNREILKEHFIFLRDAEGKQLYFCTACRAQGITDQKLKLKRDNICPACGRTVRGRMWGETVERHEPVIVFQQNEAKTEYCEKQFTALKIYDENGETLHMGAAIIAIMQNGSHTARALYYGESLGADECSQSWWTKTVRSSNFRESYVYPDNMSDILPLFGGEHSGFDMLIRHGKVNANRWLFNGYHRNIYLEYVTKRGLYRLAQEMINGGIYTSEEEDMIYLRDNPADAKRLRRINGGFCALEWLERTDTLTDDDLSWLDGNKYYTTVAGIDNALGHASDKKIVNYLRKNKASEQFLRWWADYLNMAFHEGKNLNDSIVLFPRDLKARHDAEVRAIQERQDAERQEKDRKIDIRIGKYLPEAAIYTWTDGTYTITPATCCEDLRKESRKLHHCVGTSTTYMERMASGESWILFLRKAAEPDTAYYTIEIGMDTDHIRQWYGEYDRKPDEKVIRKVLDHFKKEIGKRRQAEKRKEAVAE